MVRHQWHARLCGLLQFHVLRYVCSTFGGVRLTDCVADIHGVWDSTNKETGPYIRPHTNLTQIK